MPSGFEGCEDISSYYEIKNQQINYDKMIHEYAKCYGLFPNDIADKIDLLDYYKMLCFENRERNIEKYLIDKKLKK